MLPSGRFASSLIRILTYSGARRYKGYETKNKGRISVRTGGTGFLWACSVARQRQSIAGGAPRRRYGRAVRSGGRRRGCDHGDADLHNDASPGILRKQ